jgi:hypothetical protein
MYSTVRYGTTEIYCFYQSIRMICYISTRYRWYLYHKIAPNELIFETSLQIYENHFQ